MPKYCFVVRWCPGIFLFHVTSLTQTVIYQKYISNLIRHDCFAYMAMFCRCRHNKRFIVVHSRLAILQVVQRVCTSCFQSMLAIEYPGLGLLLDCLFRFKRQQNGESWSAVVVHSLNCPPPRAASLLHASSNLCVSAPHNGYIIRNA